MARRRPCNAQKARRPGGNTLVELLIASATAAVLTAGLAAAIGVASQAIRLPQEAIAESRAGQRLIARILRDAQFATEISELTPHAITMSVPDRDGDNNPETIRYAWSGTPGDPLTEKYNSGPETTLANNVRSLSLDWRSRFMEGRLNKPIVLFLSSSPSVNGAEVEPTPPEQSRIDLIEGWGYEVKVQPASFTGEALAETLETVNTVYVPATVTGSVDPLVVSATQGVAVEKMTHATLVGLAAGGGIQNEAQLLFEDTSHYITKLSLPGIRTVTASKVDLNECSSVGGDARELVSQHSGGNNPALVSLERGSLRHDGATTPGRRVLLPWGAAGFDPALLNDEGRILFQRAVEWASGAGEVENIDVVYEGFAETKLATDATSLVAALPTGVSEGDLLVASVAVDGNVSSNIASPAGWTLVARINGLGGVSHGVWWKNATSSEPSTATFTWTGGQEAYATVLRFTGHDPAAPVNVSATKTGLAIYNALASSDLSESPTVTTTRARCLVLRLTAIDGAAVTADVTGLEGCTPITMDSSSAKTGSVSGGAGFAGLMSPGASGALAFRSNAFTFKSYAAVTLAIAPAP